MADYLLKTEPSTYSFADLQKDNATIWDGVSNPVALRNLGKMQPADRLIIYHTGDEKSAVGTAYSRLRRRFRSQKSPNQNQSRQAYSQAGLACRSQIE